MGDHLPLHSHFLNLLSTSSPTLRPSLSLLHSSPQPPPPFPRPRHALLASSPTRAAPPPLLFEHRPSVPLQPRSSFNLPLSFAH